MQPISKLLRISALAAIISSSPALCQDPEADASTGMPVPRSAESLSVPILEPVPRGGFWQPPLEPPRPTAHFTGGIEHRAKPGAGPEPALGATLSIRASMTGPLITEPGDGHVWARTRDFRASFGSDGFVVLPVFGKQSPQEWPVVFTVESATAGGTPLDVAALGAARAEGDVVEVARRDLREVYHLDVDRVEQTFVFDTLPAGELVLRLGVDTDLVASERDGALVLSHATFGEVTYSAAFVVDAAGATLSIERAFDGEGLTFTVPASFLAEAVLPVTIDPVVTTFVSSFGATDDSHPDVCYAGGPREYFVCWQEYTSATNADVYATSFTRSGTQNTSFAVDVTSDHCATPRLAYIPVNDTILVVSSRTIGGPGGSAGAITGQLVDAATSSLVGSRFFISTIGSLKVDPDVGGTNYTNATNNHFLVAWTRILSSTTYSLEYRVIDWSGSAVTAVTNVTSTVDERAIQPAISESHGDADLLGDWWTLVWIRDTNADGRGEVMGRRVVWSGLTTFGNGNFLIDGADWNANPTVTSRFDALAFGVDRPSVVAYDYRSPIVISGNPPHPDIRARVIVDGFAYPTNTVSTSLEDFDGALHQFAPSIGTDGEGFILTYSETWYGYPTGDDHDLYMVSGHIARRGSDAVLALAERHENVAFTSAPEIHCRLAMEQDGDSQSTIDDGMCIWMRELGNTGGQLRGALLDINTLDISTDYAVGVQYCGARPNSVGQLGNGRTSSWLWMEGNQSVTRVHTARCIEMPLNSFGHLACSLQTGNVLYPGGSQGRLCLGGSIGRYVDAIQSSGSLGVIQTLVNPMALPQPTGSVAAIPGQTWYFQVWHRDSSGGSATSNFSNGCGVTFFP